MGVVGETFNQEPDFHDNSNESEFPPFDPEGAEKLWNEYKGIEETKDEYKDLGTERELVLFDATLNGIEENFRNGGGNPAKFRDIQKVTQEVTQLALNGQGDIWELLGEQGANAKNASEREAYDTMKGFYIGAVTSEIIGKEKNFSDGLAKAILTENQMLLNQPDLSEDLEKSLKEQRDFMAPLVKEYLSGKYNNASPTAFEDFLNDNLSRINSEITTVERNGGSAEDLTRKAKYLEMGLSSAKVARYDYENMTGLIMESENKAKQNEVQHTDNDTNRRENQETINDQKIESVDDLDDYQQGILLRAAADKIAENYNNSDSDNADRVMFSVLEESKKGGRTISKILNDTVEEGIRDDNYGAVDLQANFMDLVSDLIIDKADDPEVGLADGVLNKINMVYESINNNVKLSWDTMRIDKEYAEPILREFIQREGGHKESLEEYLNNIITLEESRMRVAERRGDAVTPDEKRRLIAIKNVLNMAINMSGTHEQNMRDIRKTANAGHWII